MSFLITVTAIEGGEWGIRKTKSSWREKALYTKLINLGNLKQCQSKDYFVLRTQYGSQNHFQTDSTSHRDTWEKAQSKHYSNQRSEVSHAKQDIQLASHSSACLVYYCPSEKQLNILYFPITLLIIQNRTQRQHRSFTVKHLKNKQLTIKFWQYCGASQYTPTN